MTGTLPETPQRRMAFARSCGMRSRLSLRVPGLGHATEPARAATSSRDFPFSLVYVRRDDEVEIIAVAHGRRRPGYWRSRL